jgi:hypothetical protein
MDTNKHESKQKWHRMLPVLLMLAFAASRWPSLWGESWSSFSAAYALAFCAGVYFSSRLAWWLPLGTLVLSDVVMNLFYYKVPPFSLYMLPNYFAFACLIGLGRAYSPRDSWLRLLCGGLLGAALFYLITNTNSWIQDPGYPKTLAGWIQALTQGIPGFPPTWMFFRNTLLSGGLFTGLFVGAMKLTEETEEEKKPVEEAPEPEAE